MAFSNELSDAELERLAILAEELGEAVQAVGKILRHGYASVNPLLPTLSPTNRMNLEKELGDVRYILSLMIQSGDLDDDEIESHKANKTTKIERYLHHQDAL